jgi:hypothetical protein
LPDAPVTKLRLFNNAGTKILRAATYGRGIWEFPLALGPPDFTEGVPTATLTTYPSQTVQFDGTLTAVNAYSSPVNLTCAGSKPSVCLAAPTPVTPANSPGAAFAINAANATLGDFNFTIHAAGTDSVPQIHDTNATLHVVDFAMSAPSPAAVAANTPNVSNATTFQVTGQGSFSDAVTLSCSGLPAGASCNFVPSAPVQPTSASPAAVTLTISTAANTPAPATSTITITAHDATNPEPSPKTQALSLNTTALPDYALAINNSPQTTTVLGSGTLNGTVTAVHGYAGGTVTLTCGSGAPATCTPPPPITVGADPSSVNFTVTASSPTVGSFNFNIHSTDGITPHDVPVALTVNADFHVPAAVVTCTPVAAGGVSTCSIPVGPDGQATFASNVTYPCPTAGFPNLSFCTFNPVSIPSGSAATTVVLSVHTTAAVASLRPTGPFRPTTPLLAFWLSLPALGIASLGAQRRSRKGLTGFAGALLVVALAGFLTACGSNGGGGGGQPGTAKGTYTFNVDATSNGVMHSAPMTLTVN